MLGIFLDDERVPLDVTWITYPPGVIWTVVRTVDEFLRIASASDVQLISLDHDLQEFYPEGERTGFTALKMLVDMHLDRKHALPFAFFHTQNPVGRANMREYYAQACGILGQKIPAIPR